MSILISPGISIYNIDTYYYSSSDGKYELLGTTSVEPGVRWYLLVVIQDIYNWIIETQDESLWTYPLTGGRYQSSHFVRIEIREELYLIIKLKYGA